MLRPEILAPAGSMEALCAAINAGADAVYLGGTRFGARAYAGNFDENELLEGIRYAHIYGVKVYLTVNTLFRDSEISQLYDYLLPYYKEGLDAVIVQDFGVMEFIHDHFPDLPIHASTQMTITSSYSANLLKKYGVTRIVPARELSLNEIIDIKKSIDEVEVFVHGALCISYSGQCLMSSFIGGRSGNRGRCAGSCRLPFTLCDMAGSKITTEGEYILSTKDLCGLYSIPQLVKASVDSFKIEGRMKSPEYVASCVNGYRKCVDYIIDRLNGIDDIGNIKPEEYNALIDIKKYRHIADICRDEMAEVFNRSGFTTGYFDKHNGKDMMSVVSPGHTGVKCGVIKTVDNNHVNILLDKDINVGDILMINNCYNEEITLTSNIDGKSGKVITLNAPKAKTIKTNTVVYRRFNSKSDQYYKSFIENDRKIKVNGIVTLHKGEPADITISLDHNTELIEVTHKGSCVEQSRSKPVSEDTIKDKVGQTGNSLFEFDSLKVDIDNDIFISIKELKELRRTAFSLLEDKIIEEGRRKEDNNHLDEIPDKVEITDEDDLKKLRILVSDYDQLKFITEYLNKNSDRINDYNVEIAVDLQYFDKKDIITLINEHNEYGYALPMILRREALEELKSLPLDKCKCLIVRNIDELTYIKSIGYKGKIIADYSLYSMNTKSAHFIRSQFNDSVITLPVELNGVQIKELSGNVNNSEWIIYGYQPLMVTAQCFKQNTDGCAKKSNMSYMLIDRKNSPFYTRAICKYCYNVLYNGVPTMLFDYAKMFNNTGNAKEMNEIGNYRKNDVTFRIHFTIENTHTVSSVLNTFFFGEEFDNEFTRGHFKRGVL